MKLIALGGDARIEGAVMAARRAGWEALHIRCEEEMADGKERTDALLLPWPVSIREGKLVGTQMQAEQVIRRLPPCRMVLCGRGVDQDAPAFAKKRIDPGRDEAFLEVNAQLTAEGAIARAMQIPGYALLGKTALVTGFGRIGRALTVRLSALGVFVIVCARSEEQMRKAHELGAHPVHISRLSDAAAQADVIFNTVPARIFDRHILSGIGRDTLIIELASAPCGMDMQLAEQMGIMVCVESGLPGRYAPLDAGAALFDALERAAADGAGEEEEDQNG